MALGCLLFGLLDTWLLVSLGLEFTFKGQDATLIIAIFLTVSFGLFGYFWGQALAATRREKASTQAQQEMLLKLAEVQSRIAHQEKLAALGQVVASVAHEVRNPLAIIRSQVQNLHEDLAHGDQPDPEDLEITLAEIDRLGRVVEEIGHFSRPIQPRITRVTTDDILDRVTFMARSLFQGTRGTELTVVPSPTLHLQSDPDLICQVLMILIMNALEASPDHASVTLSVDHIDDLVSFHVLDEGLGIPEDLRGQIMVPFFTTKQEGTGLGLAIANETLKALGGELIIADNPRGGTRFTLELGQQAQAVVV